MTDALAPTIVELRCGVCGRPDGELRYSCAAGLVVCERCHCAAAPAPTALVPPPYPKPPRTAPKLSAYARLHGRVWAALESVGEVFPACDGSGRMAGRCPACGEGCVSVRLIDGDPPRARLDDCSAGCAAELIARRFG